MQELLLLQIGRDYKTAERKEPMRRRRLLNKIKELLKDLSQLELSKDKKVSNVRHWKTLERKIQCQTKNIWCSYCKIEAEDCSFIVN